VTYSDPLDPMLAASCPHGHGHSASMCGMLCKMDDCAPVVRQTILDEFGFGPLVDYLTAIQEKIRLFNRKGSVLYARWRRRL